VIPQDESFMPSMDSYMWATKPNKQLPISMHLDCISQANSVNLSNEYAKTTRNCSMIYCWLQKK